MRCPRATGDAEFNAANRTKAIDKVGYGPMKDDDSFWQAKAESWDVSVDEAKTRRCGNCKVFNQSDEMKACIAQGSDKKAADTKGVGYCESLNFMCSAGNTCDAWAPKNQKKVDVVELFLDRTKRLFAEIQKKTIKEGSFVEWNSSGGKARGRVEHVMYEGTLGVPDSDFSINASEDDPAVLIRIWRDGKDGWGETETLVGHRMSTLNRINPLSKKTYDVLYIEGKATRKVRDSNYWGRPVGTPITPGMKPEGPTSPIGRARAAASGRASSSSKPSRRVSVSRTSRSTKPTTGPARDTSKPSKPTTQAGTSGGGKKPPSKPKAPAASGDKPRGSRANQTSAERADAFLDWANQFEGNSGDADKNIDVANALSESRDRTREAVIVGNGSDISDDDRRFIADILDGNPYVEIQQRENGLPKFKFTGDDEDSDTLANRRRAASEMFEKHKLGPDEKPRKGQLVSVSAPMMGQSEEEGSRVIRVEGVRDGKVFGPTVDGLEELYIEDPVDVVRKGKDRPKRRVRSNKDRVDRRVTVGVSDQARDAIDKRKQRAAERDAANDPKNSPAKSKDAAKKQIEALTSDNGEWKVVEDWSDPYTDEDGSQKVDEGFTYSQVRDNEQLLISWDGKTNKWSVGGTAKDFDDWDSPGAIPKTRMNNKFNTLGEVEKFLEIEKTEDGRYKPVPSDKFDVDITATELKSINPNGNPKGSGSLEDPIDVGKDTELAAKLLSEGKHIRMDSHMELGTLMDKLAEIGADAIAKGEKAPDYDLCKVSVPGTNLFCNESKGIPRSEMPQFKGVAAEGSYAEAKQAAKTAEIQARIDAGEEDLKLPKEADIESEWRDTLTALGIKTEKKSVPASELKATQDQLVGTQVAGMAKAIKDGSFDQDVLDSPIFVTKDGYVLDGHHRWAALVAIDMEDGIQGDVDINVEVIDAEIGYVLDLANSFADIAGIKPKSGGKKKPADAGELLQDAMERGRIEVGK